MPQYKLGKLPARKGAISLDFMDYINLSTFPSIPKQFGHDTLIKDWGMLGNDAAGDCYFAGSEHETMVYSGMGGNTIASFNQETAFADYGAVTGFDPNNPSTDQGTDMQQGAAYRKNVGLIDTLGNRHKVAAYLSLPIGNVSVHLIALYLFGAVGIGIQFPQSAMDQFNAGEIWDIVPGSPYVGGHYIPLVARRENSKIITWGKEQGMTDNFFERNNDESVVYLSPEIFKNRLSPEHFDYDQLFSDMNKLNPNSHIQA